MRTRALTAGLAAAAVALVATGCTTAGSDRPLVAVTTNILGDVVSEVVGDQADVMVLMPPGADPHSFEVSAQEAARLRSADLVVENGLGLEEGVARHVAAAAEDGVPVSTAGDAFDPLECTSGPTPPGWSTWSRPSTRTCATPASSRPAPMPTWTSSATWTTR
jgi:zinc/manganese transport system substrate-binding protein